MHGMKFVTLATLLAVTCTGAPHGFSLAYMQKLASGTKATRSIGEKSGDEVTTLGTLDSLHVVGITTHPSDAGKLIYADETALYEFDKQSGESRRVAGSESFGLILDRHSVDGIGADAKFKYITKILTRSSGVYIFDYDVLRKFTPDDEEVSTVKDLFDAEWMEKNAMTGVINEAEDKVYFSTIQGFGHFVLSVDLPDGELSSAEIITAGPSLISSMELSVDEEYLMLGDIDAKTLVRVKLGEMNSEEFVNMGNKPFYPGAMEALNVAEVVVVNSMQKTLAAFDTNSLKETAVCSENCLAKLSSPLDVAVDKQEHVIYVLDTISHPTLPTYRYTIKVIAKTTANGQAEAEELKKDDNDLSNLLKYYKKLMQLQHKGRY